MQKKYLLLIIAAALLLGVASFLSFKKPIDPDVANWKTYTNKEYGFEIKYPPTWRAELQNAGGTPQLNLLSFQAAEAWQGGPCVFDPEQAGILFQRDPSGHEDFQPSQATATINGLPAQKHILANDLCGVDNVMNTVEYDILSHGISNIFMLNTSASPDSEQYKEFVDIFEKIVHNARF